MASNVCDHSLEDPCNSLWDSYIVHTYPAHSANHMSPLILSLIPYKLELLLKSACTLFYVS